MATITNLRDTTKEQVQLLLEANKIVIKKSHGSNFTIECPECRKPEAYIYFNEGARSIECNRKNECGEKISLWDYISRNQGIDSNNKFEMLKYINQTLGLEFKETSRETYHFEQEESDKEQKFLSDCEKIFFNTLNNSKDNEQVSLSLKYLAGRGYTNENIRQFRLGFFPDRFDLLKALIESPYSYSADEATDLMNKYFEGLLKANDFSKNEETKNRITIAWRDLRDNITGFTVRKLNTEKEFKYINSNELKRGGLLFNFDTIRAGKRKSLVIVEGLLDALVGNYLVSDEVKDKYHFVATGQNCITEGQAQLLMGKGYSQVILWLDADKAGKDFLKSNYRLRKYDIVPFIVRVPSQYEGKDIDELIKNYPEADIKAMLDNATYAIRAEIEQIIINNEGALTDITRDLAIKECLRLKSSILIAEEAIYKKLMLEKLGVNIDERDFSSTFEEQAFEQDQDSTSENNSDTINIKVEIQKLKSEIQLEMAEVSKKNKEDGSSAIDIHKFRKKIDELRQQILLNDPAIDSSNKTNQYKENQLKTLNNILSNLQDFNNLLTTNYDLDKPYTHEELFKRVTDAPTGMSTGFTALDEEVSIQPSSLVFIAGKPSHGKTTLMLNLYKNLINNNPDKAFLFYSYEEEVQQIWLKIILANSGADPIASSEKEISLKGLIMQMKDSIIFATDEHKGEHKGISITNKKLEESRKEVNTWIDEGRLQILDRKPNVEILSTAIIERVKASEKPVAAIFIDYVQKLNTSETTSTRQLELQKVCQTLLNTAMDERVGAAIILGAQVNREVKSLATLEMSNMREAADIEQDANLILGVWDERAAELDKLREKLQSIEDKILELKINIEYGLENNTDYKKSQQSVKKIESRISDIENNKGAVTKAIKILKNRNGKRDKVVDLTYYQDRFLLTDYA